MSNKRLRIIDAICEQFEQTLREVRTSLLETQPSNAPAEIREPLFQELLEIELKSRMRNKPAPQQDEDLRRFPKHTQFVANVFSQLEQFSAEEMPTQIGRYRIESRLGAGGFATVYLGFEGQ